jgi:O-antigen/teichoic acid export membrane protein
LNWAFFSKIGNAKVMSLQWVQLIRTGALFLISIFLTKIFDDTDIIADYETLTLIGTSFTFFWVSGLLTNFLPYYHDNPDNRKKSVIFTSFIILTLLSGITFIAIVVLGHSFFYSVDQNLLLLFGVYIFFNSPSFLIEYLFLVKNRSKALFWYTSIIFSLQVIVFCIPLALGYPLHIAIFSWIILAILKFLFLVTLVFKEGDSSFDSKLAKEYSLRSTPIILSLLVGGSAEFIDGYIVKYFSDNKEFAIFRYGARELPLTRILANAMSVVISGEIAAANLKGNIKEGLESLKKSTSRLIVILFPLTIVLMIISPWLFRVIYNANFIPASQIFNIYLLLTVSRLLFPQTVIMGLQRNNIILKASIAELFTHISLSILFIHLLGVIGIAWAALAGEYLFKTWIIIELKRSGFQLNQYSPVLIWVVFSSLLWLVFLVLQIF